MTRLHLVALLILALTLAACGQPAPTPDIPATISAVVQSELANKPTPTPTPLIPTPDIPATISAVVQSELAAMPQLQRPELFQPFEPPEHLSLLWWEWPAETDGFREMVIDFEIANDVELTGSNGLYAMLAYSSISEVDFYLGLQTDVHAPEAPKNRGKGLIFSRWLTRDLADARFDENEGWTQSAGHEGDFIGVRRSYDWGAGKYRIRLAPDGLDSDGEWFGLWITDKADGEETWIGSLKFPLLEGRAVIEPSSYSTIEIYGDRIKPIDIPTWHVSISPPKGDGRKSTSGLTAYSGFIGTVTNSEVRYDATADVVHLIVGGETERETKPGAVEFKPENRP